MKTHTLFSLAIIVLGLLGSCATKEKTPNSKRPNIIVLLTDDQRTNTLSCYNSNCPITTPNIDKLANEGVRFNKAFVTTPICAVSRASIISGRYASSTGVHYFNTPLPDTIFQKSYPLLMKQAGYFTGMLGKYGVGVTPMVKESFDVFDAQQGQGPAFREYQGKKMHDTEWLTVKTKEFLDRVPKDKPFCLQVNYKEPHNSSSVAPEDDKLLDNFTFKRVALDNEKEFEKLPERVKLGHSHAYEYFQLMGTPEILNDYMRSYYEKIKGVDKSVGEILQNLEDTGLANNTVIIFLSDHGTHFGEKQLAGKWTPYDESLGIPFIVYDPRNKTNKRRVSDKLVLNIDVAPSLLDLAGYKNATGMDGESIVPLLDDDKVEWRTRFAYEHYCAPSGIPYYLPRHEGMRTENDKYVYWVDFEEKDEEYFDLIKDPQETNNLIANPDYTSQILELKSQFFQWRKDNPIDYNYYPNDKGFEALATQVNWKKLKKQRLGIYTKIEAEIKRLGITWQLAEENWEVRYEICKKVKFWY